MEVRDARMDDATPEVDARVDDTVLEEDARCDDGDAAPGGNVRMDDATSENMRI